MTYRLGVTPVAFLVGTKTPAITPKAFASFVPATKPDRESKLQRVNDALEAALLNRTTITTRRVLCSVAAINERSLDSLAPGVAARLAKHNESIRQDLKGSRTAAKQDQIRRAVDELVAWGGPFTARRRVALLKGMGFHPGDSWAREYFKSELANRLNG